VAEGEWVDFTSTGWDPRSTFLEQSSSSEQLIFTGSNVEYLLGQLSHAVYVTSLPLSQAKSFTYSGRCIQTTVIGSVELTDFSAKLFAIPDLKAIALIFRGTSMYFSNEIPSRCPQ
jgi:hypothetical protein